MPATQHAMIENWNYSLTWYHGSPLRIHILAAGSTITQDVDLARIFSHEPTTVAMEDDEQALSGIPRIRHNGKEEGYYTPQDIYPYLHSSMSPGYEWLTQRPLRLRLIGLVAIDRAEFLSEDDILN